MLENHNPFWEKIKRNRKRESERDSKRRKHLKQLTLSSVTAHTSRSDQTEKRRKRLSTFACAPCMAAATTAALCFQVWFCLVARRKSCSDQGSRSLVEQACHCYLDTMYNACCYTLYTRRLEQQGEDNRMGFSHAAGRRRRRLSAIFESIQQQLLDRQLSHCEQ